MQEVGKTSTPFTILGSIIAVIAIFVWLWIFIKFYRSYKSSGKKQSQYFSFALLTGGVSIFLLALELLTFQIFDAGTQRGETYIGRDIISGLNSFDLGIWFGVLAIIGSSFSIFFFVLFSLSFFEDKMKWAFIPVILLLIYVLLYLVYWPTVELSLEGTDYDITRDSQIELIMIALFIGPIFMPVVVFFISALQVRGNTFNFRRSLFLSFTHTILAIGYTIEVVGGAGLLSVLARLMILFFPIGVQYTLNPNKFMKRLLGAPS
jgi:hypothetical protein